VTVFFFASFGKKNETQNQKETTEIKSGPSTHKLWREREDDKRQERHTVQQVEVEVASTQQHLWTGSKL
jgi:hypothetical protein